MKRQLTAVLTALSMLGSLAPGAIMPAMTCITAQAETRGVTVDSMTFTIWDSFAVLTKAPKNIGPVVQIPAEVEGVPVMSIGDEAFSNCTSLTSVTIPESVHSIDFRAFFCCFSLTSVTIPDSVTSIGDGAFWACNSLTSITIPDSVTYIGSGAFGGTFITSVTIPESVTEIRDYTFLNCPFLTSVTIPDSVTRIGSGAFQETALTSVTIPESVTYIGKQAFGNCPSLFSVTILAPNCFIDHCNQPVFSNFDRTPTEWDWYYDGTIRGYDGSTVVDYLNRFYLRKYGDLPLFESLGAVPEEIVLGDVDANGKLEVRDLFVLQKWMLMVPNIKLRDASAGDLNGDGTLDVFDLGLMKRKLLQG